MTRDLEKYMKSHLPLRERVRQALIAQRSAWHRSQALAQATPEELREYNAAIHCLTHLTGNRVQFADRVGAKTEPTAMDYNSLASLGNQIEDAEERVRKAQEAIYGSGPPEPSEWEVDSICETHCRERIQAEGGPVAVTVIETATGRECGEWIVSLDLLDKYLSDRASFLFKDGRSAVASKLFDRGQSREALIREIESRGLQADSLVSLRQK